MLHIENLTKKFDDKVAVNNVSITVQKAEILVILGPSGCGKSTLLRMIAGLEKPDNGVIKLDDHTVNSPNHFTPPAKRKTGLIFPENIKLCTLAHQECSFRSYRQWMSAGFNCNQKNGYPDLQPLLETIPSRTRPTNLYHGRDKCYARFLFGRRKIF